MKEEEEKPAWELALGFYPGILMGVRSYDMGDITVHVLYIPFVDIALTIYK